MQEPSLGIFLTWKPGHTIELKPERTRVMRTRPMVWETRDARILSLELVPELWGAGQTVRLLLNSLICSGPMPQQPPTICTPCSIHCLV